MKLHPIGTTGLAVERARAQAAYAPMTPEEAVRMKRMLFLVANAGVESDYDWTQKIAGPSGVGLGMSIAAASDTFAAKLRTLATACGTPNWNSETTSM